MIMYVTSVLISGIDWVKCGGKNNLDQRHQPWVEAVAEKLRKGLCKNGQFHSGCGLLRTCEGREELAMLSLWSAFPQGW